MDMAPRRLAGVDLNLLVALDALLDEQSVTRAAERLSLSQPAMSGTLARLRRLFDDDLLVRSGRGMGRTPFAEELRAPLREALAQVERTVFARPHFDPAVDARTFTVLATDYLTLVLIRPLLEALTAEAPRVRVRVDAAGMDAPGARLRRGEADMAFLPENLTGLEELESQRLFSDRFVGAVWREHPEVGDRLTIAHLERLPSLTFVRGEVRSNAELHLQSLGFRLAPDAIFESFLLGAFLLRGTRLLAFLQERLVVELADAAGIRALEPPVELPRLVEAMWWHPRATGDPGHTWLRERIGRLARTV
jgi:DNA-binding transcriptional LysR family regulator